MCIAKVFMVFLNAIGGSVVYLLITLAEPAIDNMKVVYLL